MRTKPSPVKDIDLTEGLSTIKVLLHQLNTGLFYSENFSIDELIEGDYIELWNRARPPQCKTTIHKRRCKAIMFQLQARFLLLIPQVRRHPPVPGRLLASRRR